MARKNQQILNYRTSGTTSMPSSGDVQFGEIVVRYNYEKPQLLIKTNDSSQGNVNEDKFAVFMDSGAVKTMIETEINIQDQGVKALSGQVIAFSSSVINNYATSANVYNTLGRYATSANVSSTIDRYVKTETLTDTLKDYATSADTYNAIDAVNTIATQNQSDIGSLSTATGTFSASVYNNYVTSAEFKTKLDKYATSADVFSTLDRYATSASVYNTLGRYATSAATHNRINVVEEKIGQETAKLEAVSAAFFNFSGYVEKNYVTSANLNTKLSKYATSADVYSTLERYANSADVYSTLGRYANSADTHDAIDAVKTRVDGHDTSLQQIANSLSGVSGGLYSVSGSIITYIDNKLSVVYKYKGSVADYNALTAITTHDTGDVYNVVAAHGEPGESGYTPAGTNYAWNGTAWDALGGTVDLSNYITQDEFTGATQDITDLKQSVEDLSGATSAFSASVVKNYVTSADLNTKLSDYATSANTYNAIKGASGNIATHLTSNYATSANTHAAISAVSQNVDTLTNSLSNLSGATSAFSASVVKNYVTSADLNTKLSKYATSADTHNTINTVSGNIKNHLTSTYATSADTHNAIAAVDSKASTNSTNLNSVSGAFINFSGYVKNNYVTSADLNTKLSKYATSADTHNAIKTASGNIATHLTSTYATSADTHAAISGVSQSVDTLTNNLSNLSGATSALSASVVSVKSTADSALQSFQLGEISGNGNTTQSGAKASYTDGGSAKLDLSNLVIDCGEF